MMLRCRCRTSLRFLATLLSLLVLKPRCSSHDSRLCVVTVAVAEAAFVASSAEGRDHQPIQTTKLYATDSAVDEKPFRGEDSKPRAATTARVVDKYHLLWSPGAWRKLIVGTTTLFLAHMTSRLLSWSSIADPSSSTAMSSLVASVATNFALPMLASACCLLQLGLNLLSVGCAGFNTVLGPVRPYFISLLLYLTAVERLSKHAPMTTHWAFVTALRWAVALLPEALHLWNHRETFLPKQQPQSPSSRKLQAVVQLEIPTMGCVACVSKIDKALNKVDRVLTAKSSLADSGGQAEVQITADTQAEVDAIVASLTDAVSEAGFSGSSVESVQVQNTKTAA